MAQATGLLTVRHRVDLAISPPAAGAALPEKQILQQLVAKLPWFRLGIIRRGNRPPPPRKVPEPVPPTKHGFKYRLVYIVVGLRVVGFDNERGDGDHRHDGEKIFEYQFQGIDRLMSDFAEAVEQWRAEHGQD